MQFAKLFDFTDPTAPGQLLVLLAYSEEREDADAPYLLVCKTIGANEFVMKTMQGYATQEKRDAEFSRFDERMAEDCYYRMQAVILL